MSLIQKILYYKPSVLTLTSLMFGVICIGLLQNIYLGRQPDKQLYNELSTTLDSASSAIIPDIEKIIAEGVELVGITRPYEERASTYAEQVFALSQELTHTIDSIKNNVASSNRKKDKYIDDYTLNRLSLLIKNYIDTSAKILYFSEREAVQSYLHQTFWGGLQYDSTWLSTLFKHQKKEEAIAILSSIKLNTLNTVRYVVYRTFWNNIGCILSYDEIHVIAVPNTPFIFKGDNANAIMFIGQYDKTINPTITTNVKSNIKVENGLATIASYAKTPGIKILSGTASIKIEDSIHSYPWQTQYYVAPKGIYMHVDNANKCYAGIPFNMTIGLEEYNADKLSLRSNDAVIKKITDNTYSITTRKGVKSFMVYMDAINDDGSISKSVAAKHIIVLQPIPDIGIGDIKHGLISKAYISQHTTLSAIAKDEELDITYHIKQYDISYIKAGNKYTEPVTIQGNTLINTNTLQSGDRIFITDVIVTDNYGNTHIVHATSFRVE